MAFVRPNLPIETRRANFVVILEWLRNLSGKDDTPLQEACIMTLCGLAMYVSHSQCPPSPMMTDSWMNPRVSEDEEKNIILLRLLEYLGHPNPYVCAVAYNEVGIHQIIATPGYPIIKRLKLTLHLVIQTRTTVFIDACRPISTLLENPLCHGGKESSISSVYG